MSNRPGFMETLMAAPQEPSSRAARFVSHQGFIYMLFGVCLMLGPSSLLSLLNGMSADEQAMVRLCGLTLTLIGWFYYFGGRTGAASFALCTVADRAVVPFALAGLVWFGGVSLQLVAPLAVLDPILAVLTWRMWRAEHS